MRRGKIGGGFLLSALIVGGAVVVLGVLVTGGRGVVKRGDGQTAPATHLQIIATAQAEQVIQANPRLKSLRWLVDSPEGTPPTDALEFPPGLTYEAALRALYLSLGSRGTLPPGTALVPALPARAVLKRGDAVHGVRIDLQAPWGWDLSTGQPVSPSVSYPGDLPIGEVESLARMADRTGQLPAHAIVDAPKLPACQVIQVAESRPETSCPNESTEVKRG